MQVEALCLTILVPLGMFYWNSLSMLLNLSSVTIVSFIFYKGSLSLLIISVNNIEE